MERAGADFRPLIEALQAASADPQATLREQLATLELFLVSAQLNPNPIPAVELAYSLRVLAEIDTQGINPAQGTAELSEWFDN